MPATLDPRGIRFTAAITSVILAIGLVTGSWRVLAVQTVLFALCAFVGMGLNPWGAVYRSAVAPRLRAIPESERESPAPVRFSQGVGFAFAVVATAGYALEWTTLGMVANALALVAALLNAAFGYCLGCQLYLVLRRFGPVKQEAR
ncbi:DUF4395 domain-containing protein [Saccharopolyspora sp. 6V]|nr:MULTISPECIES: DUF4395 domain-containing protein [unclassified Saccharopolyspora]MCA1188939.1 DUF4395 domain-containing protein [Saccharopolyspora sp. 6T]MCA1192926.1 DUF4395 domain-containing protein [Saccharopolyspora sp. 6V]MCA1226754.1 DUF4395 domain-containing protein [Saccharopolyspora sp. 6M]MCA1282021.1 DUF4395 domain-containing protein [Saccharopolyspora sp. 7B]